MFMQRAQWPHTIDDIVKSLDGVWGLVGATADNGNLMRLERSLFEPVTYTLTIYEGSDERKVLSCEKFDPPSRQEAINKFAQALGFEVN